MLFSAAVDRPTKGWGETLSSPLVKRVFCKICHLKGSTASTGGGAALVVRACPNPAKVGWLQEETTVQQECLSRVEALSGLQGTAKLVLSPKYLCDQRTAQFSHAWTRKSHLNLLTR